MPEGAVAQGTESAPKREDSLVRTLGWPATILQGDVTIFDRWRWLRRRLRGGPLRTLDAGSGSGAFSMYAARRGNRVTGISFDERNNESAERRARMLGIDGIRFVRGDLRELDGMASDLGTFDQIICQETIEHIADDAKLARDLAALLAPGGRLFMTTPSADHRPVYGEMELHNWTEDGGHVRYGYSHQRLRELLEAAGLEVVEQGHVIGMLSQWVFSLGAVLVMRLRVPLRMAWALTFPLRVLQLVDGPVTRLTRHPCFSVTTVAEQPKR